MSLAATSLPIGQYRGVVACKAAENEVTRADLVDIFLPRLLVEHSVKAKLVCAHRQLVILGLRFDAWPLVSSSDQLTSDERTDSDCNLY